MKIQHSIRLGLADVVIRRFFPTKKRRPRPFRYGDYIPVLFSLELNGFDRTSFDLLGRRGPLWFIVGAHESLRRWWLSTPIAWRGCFYRRSDYTASVNFVFFCFYVSLGWCHTPNFERVDPLTFSVEKGQKL